MTLAVLSLTADQSLLAVWLFALGGAVGSFLNVVVYRLPAGMSLIHPRSHCPACKHPIRWHDNVPVVSWLVLKGRCRDCRVRIAVRYPLVEAATAALFLLVGLIEGLSLGANLPARPHAVAGGVVFRCLATGEAVGITAYHLILLCTLLAAGLIEADGHRLPWRLVIPAAAVGGFAPLVWPYLHPVPAVLLQDETLAGLVDGGAGLALGAAIGLAGRRLIGPRDSLSLVIGPALAGLYLGWQAVAALALAVLAVHAVARPATIRWPALRRASLGLWWLAAAGAWILAWEPILRGCPPLGFFALVDSPRAG